MPVIKKIENDTEIDRILNRDFVSEFRSGYVEVGEDKFCLPIYYEKYEETFRTLKVSNDDVFLCGHPKTGTTWAQEMLWLIVNNFDYDTATKEIIYERSPQLEYIALFDTTKLYKDQLNMQGMDYYYRTIERAKSPRVIKSHLHWSLLPEEIRNGSKKPKIIVILREPEDTCISLYYYSQTAEGYKGSFENFCKLFLAGRVCFGPFWKQVLSYWNERHRSNILFIKYKDMKNNLPGVITTIVKFLEKSITEEQLSKLTDHLSFESMKKNPTFNFKEKSLQFVKHLEMGGVTNNFLRLGNVGGYKSEMSPEIIAKFEAWTRENTEGTDLFIK